MTTEAGHEWAGAYVLGALSADDRLLFESHLAQCESCARDVVEFSVLPGLLSRIDERDLAEPPASVRAHVVAATEGGRTALARSLTRWRVLAGAAAVLALVLGILLVDDDAADAPQIAGEFHALEVGSDYQDLTGTIELSGRAWGTLILIDLFDAPQRDEYTMWTVDETGAWDEVTTWAWSDDGTCRVPGTTTLAVDAIDRVVVTAAGDKDDSIAWGT